jgi:hypothetical protein
MFHFMLLYRKVESRRDINTVEYTSPCASVREYRRIPSPPAISHYLKSTAPRKERQTARSQAYAGDTGAEHPTLSSCLAKGPSPMHPAGGEVWIRVVLSADAGNEFVYVRMSLLA